MVWPSPASLTLYQVMDPDWHEVFYGTREECLTWIKVNVKPDPTEPKPQ